MSSFSDVFAAGLEQVRKSWGWFLGFGILLSILGIVCVGKAQTATTFSILALGWVLMISGVLWLLIGLWAILVGVLELLVAKYSSNSPNDRALFVIAAFASIVVGVGLMRWAFVGAIVISAFVGIAAAARGTSRIIIGVSERLHQPDGSGKQAMRRDGA
jgi:uncharacterized membrane protein HdeD (DUF308 family)